MSDGGARPELLEIGEILLQQSRLTEEQLAQARKEQEATGVRLTDILVSEGFVNAEELLEALGQQLALPVHRELGSEEVDEALIERVPIGFAKTHGLLPLRRADDATIRVVVSDPLDTAPLDDLRLLFDGAEIVPELATERAILAAINEVYDRRASSTSELAEDAAEDLNALASEISQEPQDLLESSDEAPIIKLVNSLL